jgi:protein-S-isoprenylcysteine O-methyltransferase Ste14
LIVRTTFIINHFELFGLHQAAKKLAGPPAKGAERLRAPLLDKLLRNPIYLGFIVAFWVAPTMTAGHLLFAATLTAYICAGIFFEERDLVDLFGYDDRRHGQRASMPGP